MNTCTEVRSLRSCSGDVHVARVVVSLVVHAVEWSHARSHCSYCCRRFRRRLRSQFFCIWRFSLYIKSQYFCLLELVDAVPRWAFSVPDLLQEFRFVHLR